jgi:hypothetical protein
VEIAFLGFSAYGFLDPLLKLIHALIEKPAQTFSRAEIEVGLPSAHVLDNVD